MLRRIHMVCPYEKETTHLLAQQCTDRTLRTAALIGAKHSGEHIESGPEKE